MNKVPDSDIEYGDDRKYYHNGRLFTGTIIEYGDSGVVLSECEVNEGLMHGHWVNYFLSGALRMVEEYKHGFLVEGIAYDEHGNTREKWSIYDEDDDPWFNIVKRRLREIDAS